MPPSTTTSRTWTWPRSAPRPGSVRGLADSTAAAAAGRPSALALETVAPDGYSGPIALLVGVDREGRVLGVRVTAHRETPGLGDGIESRRGDWILQFAGRSLGEPAPERWRVRREGGDFDALVGATVTSRAVIGAVERALRLVGEHGEALYGEPPPALACPPP
ncbi:MAG: RnfABCDGE type electron transport complex subunit G [Xanthomonadales bacterium]|nr:RnfABCDGE type electron transport complex subunit G [Xanthomonadales bacterium]